MNDPTLRLNPGTAVQTMQPSTSTSIETPTDVTTAPTTPSASETVPAGSGLNAAIKGKMVAFVAKPVPETLPPITFEDASGRAGSLAQWRGKFVLLNFWATWCAPCRLEMPSLDALKKARGGPDFDVIAVSTDRDGIPKAKAFLDQLNVTALEPLVDPTSKSAVVLKVTGMPTTLLIDREGREIGRLTGPGEWDSEDAKRLIEAAIKGTSDGLTTQDKQALVTALRQQIMKCWNPPTGATGTQRPTVRLAIELDEGGRLKDKPRTLKPEASPTFLRAVESVIRAIYDCQPFNLPAEHYAVWRSVMLKFDPSE